MNPSAGDNLIPLLKASFGFASFRPGQAEAISRLSNGEHTMVVMPTGAGKSLVYQFFAVSRPGVTLVISPLISLMQDQVDSLARRRIPATFINSSIPGQEQLARLEAMAAGQYRLVYVAPERLRSNAFQQALAKTKLSLLAVDEAHCVSQWGHDFRPDYLHIAAARARWGNPLTAALTATATPRVRDDIVSLLGLSSANHLVTGFNRPNLTFEVNYCRDAPGKLRALLELIKSLNDGAAIIYAGTRRDSEEVADFISETAGVRAEFYHGGMVPEAREKAQTRFMRGDTRIVVATNAFGMGIDRADVRLVAHYSIPGSLEAYYQEAGRAGRDGDPARAVLLYCPDDKSLQEYFIDNSVLGVRDLRTLHSALTDGAWLSGDDISLATSLHEVAVRVGLSVLESIGAARISGTEGPRSLIHSGPLKESDLTAALALAERRLDHRRDQLSRMVAYAETNHCRRRTILHHFGDPGDCTAPRCCDNCLAPAPDAMAQAENGKLTPENKTALLILDAVNDVTWPVGRGKIAKLLKGSRAQEVAMFGYERNPRHGKLAVFSQPEIEGLIDKLIEAGYLKVVGTGKLPVLRLTGKGEASLSARAPIPLTFPRQITKADKSRKLRKHESGNTVEITWSLHQQGMSIADIAKERDLAEWTVYTHIGKLIGMGRIDMADYVSDERATRIRAAISEIGDTERLAPIKAILPDDYHYWELRCVVEADTLHGSAPEPSNRQTITPSNQSDPVSAYLSRSHPRPLDGPWNAGWALGFHSSFAGSDWSRSGIGELTYRLKYRSDASALKPLVDEAMRLCEEHPELLQVDAIVPVPPSTPRAVDPVTLFCGALGGRAHLPVLRCIERTRQTQPQKEMRTLAQKRANVAGVFTANTKLIGRRVLLIDDLYDSGATLDEVAKTLSQAGARSICVLTLTRTIHSDA